MFAVKRALLQLRRAVSDRRAGLRRYASANEAPLFFAILAEHRSSLWTEDSLAERSLQNGKVQNLRVAVRRLNGTVIPAYAVFSFWHQIGAPARRHGFVEGRELREGCLIPAIGGGLCQLSNALYAAALDAGAEIVERHPHSRVVPGSAAVAGRDATVAFNYVDLQFRFDVPVRIEAYLTSDTLTVRFQSTPAASACCPTRSLADAVPIGRSRRELRTVASGSCMNCGQESCFRHSASLPLTASVSRTAFLMAGLNADFARFAAANHGDNDTLLLPLDGARWGMDRFRYPTANFARIRSAATLTLRQLLAARLHRREKNALKRARRRRDTDALALAYDRMLRPGETHLVVDQELLPTLWRNGTLGGRTFDVFVSLPALGDLQASLDAAAARWPESKTFADFRADPNDVVAERQALSAARRIVTTHPEIAAAYGDTADLIPRVDTVRAAPILRTGGRFAVFPGPTIGRKGCYELRAALRALDLPVLVLCRNLENPDFWQGLDAAPCPSDDEALAQAAVVVYPSLWETRPRSILLAALERGIPVIVTPGCGLGHQENVFTVPFGDANALEKALRETCFSRKL